MFSVYVLMDTRKPFNKSVAGHVLPYKPFYVGKARSVKNRVSSHLSGEGGKSAKAKRIRAIRRAGFDVGVAVVRESLPEEKAFSWERKLIARLGRKDNATGVLLNNTNGGQGVAGRIIPSTELLMRGESIKWARQQWDEAKKAAHNNKLRAAWKAKSSEEKLEFVQRVNATKAAMSATKKLAYRQKLRESRQAYLSSLSHEERSALAHKGVATLKTKGLLKARTKKKRKTDLAKGLKAHRALLASSSISVLRYGITNRAPTIVEYSCPTHGIFTRRVDVVKRSLVQGFGACSQCNKGHHHAK